MELGGVGQMGGRGDDGGWRMGREEATETEREGVRANEKEEELGGAGEARERELGGAGEAREREL
eukprot:6042135-Pleurochrysis_carterae.AAC.1